MSSSPSQTSAGPVSAAYAALVARGALSSDPAQHDAVGLLDDVLAGLETDKPKGLLSKLLNSKSEPVRGLYLYGEVGRGKTMLMDLFFATAPITATPRSSRA